MTCQSCNSTRLIHISAKCGDLFWDSISEKSDYPPTDIGIGTMSGYVEMVYCLDCGQIQGKWPLPESWIEEYYNDNS